MKPKIILCLTLVLSGVLFGCSTATHRSAPPIQQEQNANNAISTLHVGMTIGEADQELGHYGLIRVFTVSSAVRHCYHYFGLPDVNEIMLQFDEHEKLVSWEVMKDGLKHNDT
jgi:hypothetical protein